MKNVAVLTDDVAFALFFRPHPGGFGSSKVPPNQRREFAIQNANDRGSTGGGGGREALGTAGIDWCIISQNDEIVKNSRCNDNRC